jgi:hyaluronan synthase
MKTTKTIENPTEETFTQPGQAAVSLTQKILLFIAGLIIIFVIIFLKTRSLNYLYYSPALFFYTMFITLFRISRIWAAMLYDYTDQKIKALSPYKSYAKEVTPFITFVIPCKNEEAVIGRTVEKCFQSDYPKDKFEVIVINDGSTDGTIDVLNAVKRNKKYKNLIIVDWKVNQGKRFGMAEGFRMAKGEIVITLDSDSYVDPSTVGALVDYFGNPEVGAVCAHAYVENADTNYLTKMQSALYYVGFRINKAAESSFGTIFCCSGCSSAYRKDIVMPILDQWLNETFLGLPVTWGDDRGLTNWIIKSRYKTIYTDSARAYTVAPETWKQYIKQQVRWKKGWFVNSYFVSKFILQEQPFVALTYFFPLTLITVISPFVALQVIVWDGLLHGSLPLYFVGGAILLNGLFLIYCKILAPNDKYFFYIFLSSMINMFFMTYVIFYAVATIQNRKWGTR